jgi:xanthine dehydrogenase accessory factor
MFSELVSKINEFHSRGINFAIAQVIDREAPCSGKVGDKALILETGELIGWIGGGCVRGIVIKEALEVIKTKHHSRVRISPEGGNSISGNLKNYIMSCQSEGTVEVLIEPILTQPELIVAGKSEIARKLSHLAASAGFKVTAMANDADAIIFPSASVVKDKVDFSGIASFKNCYVVIATQGEDDEGAVLKAMQTASENVGFVASRKKADHIRAYLTANGISKERVLSLQSPVGLDINAKLASEVAISILAGVIGDFRGRQLDDGQDKSSIPSDSEEAQDQFSEDYYINPVCDVPVSKKNPKHIIEYKGEKVYFCCDGCKVSFEKDPALYMEKSG